MFTIGLGDGGAGFLNFNFAEDDVLSGGLDEDALGASFLLSVFLSRRDFKKSKAAALFCLRCLANYFVTFNIENIEICLTYYLG